MASGSGTCDLETKERNYLRLQLLLVNEGTGILRTRFDLSIPANNLQNTLKKYKTKFQKDKCAFVDKLCPKSGNVPNSNEFDISLLVYLLRTINVCNLKRKSQWWNEKDNSNIPDTVHDEEADITRIKNIRNEMQHRNVASLEKVEFESMWDILENAMLRIASKCGITDQQQRIDAIKNKKLDVVSTEMINLRKNSEIFLDDYNDDSHFVETESYKEAKKQLENNKILVLTGHPGEGKSTMATRLALSACQPRNCVILSKASDWRILDLELKLTDTVVIDDIFGDGALDSNLVSEWKNTLPEIERAAKKGYIRVILTSRNYIFEQAKEEMSSLPHMFKDESGYIFHLTSSKLSSIERRQIFHSLALKNNQEISDDIINECVEAAVVSRPQNDDESFVFGYPECVSMFLRNDDMFSTGAKFFEKPASHFIEYLQDLYKGGKDKFMALVAVWIKENKRLALDELKNTKTVSDPIKRMADVFDIELNKRFLDLVVETLKTHDGDFLIFNKNTDEYRFSHSIIGDMVGIVVGKKKPEEAVEVCPRDFLMERVSVDEENEYFVVFVKERKYEHLSEKFTNMILRRNCNKLSETEDSDDFQMLKRNGKRGNNITVHNKIDFGIIKHKAFSLSKFVIVFLDYIQRKRLVRDVFSIPVMSLNGYFLDYGILMPTLDMCLIGYAWISKALLFAQEVMKRKEIKEIGNLDPAISLLLATHSNDRNSIQFLLDNGAQVTGDVIYIAAHKNIKHLEMFLRCPGVDVNDRGNAVNGNYPLIIAARKGFKDVVSCMLKFGCNPGVQNTAKMTALHKAVLYKRTDIITLLIEANAPLDIRGGKYKRTPLHIAADLGNLDIVKQLVCKGASLIMKDHRRQIPIHIAAIRNKVEIVKHLFSVDRKQETLRISSYGSKSLMKGMSLFHVAIWKKNSKLLDALVHMDANPNIKDFYGRTPLFYAIMEGHKTLVQKMLAYVKTDKAKPEKQGYTPLHAAIHKTFTAIAKQLIPHTNVNARDRYGKTPLHVACEKVNIVLIKSLLGSGADPAMITKRGDTVYHLLKRRSNLKSIKTIEESNEAQALLAEWDPDFFKQLPYLKNKAGTLIRIHYEPNGSKSRNELLQHSQKVSQESGKAESEKEIDNKSDDEEKEEEDDDDQDDNNGFDRDDDDNNVDDDDDDDNCYYNDDVDDDDNDDDNNFDSDGDDDEDSYYCGGDDDDDDYDDDEDYY